MHFSKADKKVLQRSTTDLAVDMGDHKFRAKELAVENQALADRVHELQARRGQMRAALRDQQEVIKVMGHASVVKGQVGREYVGLKRWNSKESLADVRPTSKRFNQEYNESTAALDALSQPFA